MSDYINGKKETDTVIDFYSIYMSLVILCLLLYTLLL